MVGPLLRRFAAIAVAVATLSGMSPSMSAPATPDIPPKPAPAAMSADLAREEYAYTLGVQAWIFGYPSVEMFRVRHHAVFDTANPTRTPINEFRHRRELLGPLATTVVAPNNDTLYSSAWLDLSREPIVLDVPDTGGRYYVMQFMDFYSNNFAYVGKRSTGTGAGSYVIAGPEWRGALPGGTRRIDAPTNEVWLLGRTLVDGKDDLPAVYAIQDHYRLTPLGRWLKGERGSADAAVPPDVPSPPAFDLKDPLNFFAILDAALKANPPPARDAGLMNLLAPIDVGPDKTFKESDLDAATAKGLRRALEMAPQLIAALPTPRPNFNGWLGFANSTGNFGADYLYRAYIARFALAANDPAEAHNFSTVTDAKGQKLNGSRRYRLRFDAGNLPPVDAFWSLTLYGVPGGMLVDNPIARYSLGDRSKQLQYGKDGSLEIYVQHDSPGPEHESNWLPAPEGDFNLSLRCYMPKPQLISDRWAPPSVEPLEP